MDKEKTKVIFRQWRNGYKGIIAMFPELAVDTVGYNCESFEHVGQHGAASPLIVLKDTTLADADSDEIKTLMKELKGRGYNLEVIKRFRYEHLQTRMAMYN